MELLTPRFLKTVGLFTGLHTLVWFVARIILENTFGENPHNDLLLGFLLVTGIPIALMYCAQITRRITDASWLESMCALLIAGPLSFALAFQVFFFLGIEATIYLASVNLMGLFLLPLWDPRTRTEYNGELAIPERPILAGAVLGPLVVALVASLFARDITETYSVIMWVATSCFFFGSIASVVLACLKQWKNSAIIGAAGTVTFIVGISVILLLELLQ